MAYTKQSFTDHVKDANGNVVQRGTLIKKEHLDHMEDGIFQAHEQLARKLSAPASPQVGQYLRIKSIATDGTMVVEGVPAPEAALPERPTFRDVSLVPQSDQNAGATLVPEGTAEQPKVGLYGCHGNEPVEICNVAEATADQSAPNLAQVREMISAAMDGTIVPAGTVTLTENGDYDVTQYANAEVAIPEVQQALPEITVNQDTGSIGYKITQEEGYVAGGTQFGTIQQPAQAAKTVTPGVSAKTAVAKGRYVTGDVIVAGDPNLDSKNIRKNVTLFGILGDAPEEVEAESLNAVHQWEKYSVSEEVIETEKANEWLTTKSTGGIGSTTIEFRYADEFKVEDGSIVLVGATITSITDANKSAIVGKYIYVENEGYYRVPADATVTYSTNTYGESIIVSKIYQLSLGEVRTLIGVVLSEDIEAYPADGEQDGYRYVYIGTLENTGNSGGGENGATFTPAVSEDGTLSWSNDKGLENPAPVNIKGHQGDPGGYYTPVVTQPSENMLQFGWTPSKSDMPSRPPAAFVFEFEQDLCYNAKSHGAKGDGATDDSPALNALVTAVHDAGGGTIWLPKGVYMLDSPILWQSNVSLRGEGMGLAILKTRQAAGVGEGFAAIRGLTFSADDPCVNCKFEQFTIDGEEMQITEYTSYPKGINIHFMSNCVFRDMEIRNTCATGLGVDHLRNSVVDHVVCINCGRSWTGNGVEQNVGGAGIGIGTNCMEGESLIVQNCVADGCGNYGIFFEKQGYTYPGKAEGHVIANNVVRNGRNHGIVIKGDANVVVTDNVVFGNANDGLAVLENNGFVTEHIMFCNNLVRGNGNGFRLESDGVCRDITLSGNVFNGNENGIVLNTDTTELSLIGNTIKNSTTAVTVQGIHADVVVRNNVIYKNTVGESIYGTFTGVTSQNDLYSASVDLSAYTRLEYIQSNGEQYINTGFIPDSNTRVMAKTWNDYALDVLAYAICGTRTASKNKEFDLRCSSQFYYGSSMVDTMVSHSGVVDFNKNALTVNNVSAGTAPAESFECEYPLYIFALNGAGTALSNTMAVMRLYYLNIFDNDTLVRAMIPVRRKSDGAVGLVDTLTGTFYENLGSGTFTGA